MCRGTSCPEVCGVRRCARGPVAGCAGCVGPAGCPEVACGGALVCAQACSRVCRICGMLGGGMRGCAECTGVRMGLQEGCGGADEVRGEEEEEACRDKPYTRGEGGSLALGS